MAGVYFGISPLVKGPRIIDVKEDVVTITETLQNRAFDHTKIAKVRKARGMTQVEFAQQSGIPLDMVREYERHRSNPSVERLFIIVNTLGCSVEDLTTPVV